MDKITVTAKWCTITNALIAKYKEQTDTEEDLSKTYNELCFLEELLIRTGVLERAKN